MDPVVSSRQARAQHRHELRTLTYVTLDQANGGIVRNLSCRGIGIQAVAAVRPQQRLRVRFELRYPRLQVEGLAEVVWSTFSGQCGIRFVGMPAALKRQINEWIISDLLERVSLHTEHSESIFAHKAPESNAAERDEEPVADTSEADDGLMIAAGPVKVIELPLRSEPPQTVLNSDGPASTIEPLVAELDWLSQPLSGRTLAWTVDALMVMASLLLFTLVFLSVTRESPRWPLAMAAGASLAMAGLYWAFFRVFAGASLGTRLARIAEADGQENREARFR